MNHYSTIRFLLFGIGLTILVSCTSKQKSNEDLFIKNLDDNQMNFYVELAQFDKNAHMVSQVVVDPAELEANGGKLTFNNTTWKVTCTIKSINTSDREFDVDVHAKIVSGLVENATIGIVLEKRGWSKQSYLMMPSAAYNGNRYRSVRKQRGKQLYEVVECSPDMEPVITNIPRLNIDEGVSKLQILSGDMATPSIGYQQPETQQGFFILTDQGVKEHYYAYQVKESVARDTAFFTIRVPGVREDSVYKGGSNPFYPSTDKGYDFIAGDELQMNSKIYFFESPTIQSLYDKFVTIRKTYGDQEIPLQIPYSAAWKLQEAKYNTQSWVDEFAYYAVGMKENPYQNWQTGWTGGMNTVYPLFFNGDTKTRERVVKTFDFLFDSISPSGFLYDVFHEGAWYLKDKPNLLRRNSDALFFIIKTYELIEQEWPDYDIPVNWESSAQRCADAFVTLFERYGQFGQRISNRTGEIVVGGSCSNALASGALALCYQRYGNQEYLNTALESAEYHYGNFVQKGMTNGGPGDNYLCPDSESAFAMLESFVTLYEVTLDEKWLQRAREMANQCASWVVTYNFNFPAHSTFAKMDMKTTGTVYANVQNKHAAPGICSLSGNSLFRLFRATKDTLYLDLMRDIMKTMPQYMSRTDRPIPDVRPGVPYPEMPSGWINERVNMSDWEERGEPGNINRGEIFGGTCWSETAFMLTYTEVPGLYILKDTQQVFVLDNIEAKVVDTEGNQLVVELYNPTKFDASVRTIIETSKEAEEILPRNYLLESKIVEIKSGEREILEIPL